MSLDSDARIARRAAALETIRNVRISDSSRLGSYLALARGSAVNLGSRTRGLGAGGSGGEEGGTAGVPDEPCNRDTDCPGKWEWVDGVCTRFKGVCESDVDIGNYCKQDQTSETDPTGKKCGSAGEDPELIGSILGE